MTPTITLKKTTGSCGGYSYDTFRLSARINGQRIHSDDTTTRRLGRFDAEVPFNEARTKPASTARPLTFIVIQREETSNT